MKYIGLLLALLLITGKVFANNEQSLVGVHASELRTLVGEPEEIRLNSLTNKSTWFYSKFKLDIKNDRVIATEEYQKSSPDIIKQVKIAKDINKLESKLSALATPRENLAKGLIKPLATIDQKQLTEILKETQDNSNPEEREHLGSNPRTSADKIREKMLKMKAEREKMLK